MWGGVYTKMVQTSPQDCCSLPPSRSRPGMKEMAPTVTWWSTQKWYRHPQQAEALLSLLSEVILGNKEMTLPVVWGSTQRWYEQRNDTACCVREYTKMVWTKKWHCLLCEGVHKDGMNIQNHHPAAAVVSSSLPHVTSCNKEMAPTAEWGKWHLLLSEEVSKMV